MNQPARLSLDKSPAKALDLPCLITGGEQAAINKRLAAKREHPDPAAATFSGVSSSGRISSREIKDYKISHNSPVVNNITQRCDSNSLAMPMLPRNPPTGGSLELVLQNLLPEDATPWQEEVADVIGIPLQPRPEEMEANAGTSACVADYANNQQETTTMTNATCTVVADFCPTATFNTPDMCPASSTLNTPVLEVPRLPWPSTTKSVLSPKHQSVTKSPLVSGASTNRPFNLIPLESQGEPMKPSTLGALDLHDLGFDNLETLRSVDPYSLTDSAATPPVVHGFDDLWDNFEITGYADFDLNEVDVEGILSLIEQKEELAENVTELMVPVVPMVLPKASQDHNMKQDVQADPAPFTILVKSEDMPSQVFQPQPGTSFDFPAPSMMPTTIEEVKDKVLDEPIVVPKFNRPTRKRKASELCVPKEEHHSETELAPTILMLSEGRVKKTRGRPPLAKREITTVPALNHKCQQKATTDDSESLTSDFANMSEAEISDLKYRRMRDLNNEASKRCREKRKMKFQELVNERDIEFEKNGQLREKLESMMHEVENLKEYLTKNWIAPNVAPTLANTEWHQQGLSQEEFRRKYFQPKPE